MVLGYASPPGLTSLFQTLEHPDLNDSLNLSHQGSLMNQLSEVFEWWIFFPRSYWLDFLAVRN